MSFNQDSFFTAAWVFMLLLRVYRNLSKKGNSEILIVEDFGRDGGDMLFFLPVSIFLASTRIQLILQRLCKSHIIEAWHDLRQFGLERNGKTDFLADSSWSLWPLLYP